MGKTSTVIRSNPLSETVQFGDFEVRVEYYPGDVRGVRRGDVYVDIKHAAALTEIPQTIGGYYPEYIHATMGDEVMLTSYSLESFRQRVKEYANEQRS